jgi:hypothetical protein
LIEFNEATFWKFCKNDPFIQIPNRKRAFIIGAKRKKKSINTFHLLKLLCNVEIKCNS